jgi:hypothetical protein
MVVVVVVVVGWCDGVGYGRCQCEVVGCGGWWKVVGSLGGGVFVAEIRSPPHPDTARSSSATPYILAACDGAAAEKNGDE